MMNTLQFNLSVPTPYVFIKRFLKAAQSQKELELLSFYLMDMCLVEYEMLKFPPSLLAAAAVFTAECTLTISKQWTKTSETHSHYSEHHLLDGVSESQFNQVLNIELDQMIKAYLHLGEVDVPKFTVIVAQKNHHTKFFQASGPENVPARTVVDSKVVHPNNYDFYMCAQSGMLGTLRPAHYHVLLDEIGFSPDNLQNLILTLSYVYQRSSTATSIVGPISYAHLAAQQMGQFLKFADLSENSLTSVGTIPIPELPKLHEDVQGSMFFC